MVLRGQSQHLIPGSEPQSTHLSDKVEGNHVSRLSGNGVWCKLELIVGSYRDRHDGCGYGQALGKSRAYDGGEEHGGWCRKFVGLQIL